MSMLNFFKRSAACRTFVGKVSRDEVLFSLHCALIDDKIYQTKRLLDMYQRRFGKLSLEETYVAKSLDGQNKKVVNILECVPPSAKDFLCSCISGNGNRVQNIEEKEHQSVLQKKLVYAYQRRDFSLFDELLKQGADLEYVYYSPAMGKLTSLKEVILNKVNRPWIAHLGLQVA